MMFQRAKISRAATALAAALIFTSASSQVANAQQSYQGRTISVVIGFSVGGAYDLYARVLSRHMGRHIQGAPKLVPQNMPGAGGLKAASFLYEIAPKDGTTIGTFARGNVIGPLFGEGTFDSTKFNWIGSVTDDVNVCLAWHTSPIKSWNDLLTKPFTVAGQGPQADPNIYASIVKNVFGAPIKIIGGYPGTSEIGLAMERGEVDGVCAISYSTVKTVYAEKLKNKQINIIFQAGLKKALDLPDVPLLLDLARNDGERNMLMLIMGVQGFARPFVAPPGLPESTTTLLRDAFMTTMRDSEFLAEATKHNLEVNPSGGREVSELVTKLYNTPKDVIEAAKSAIAQR